MSFVETLAQNISVIYGKENKVPKNPYSLSTRLGGL